MVKRRAAATGLDGLFAGHSMRAGFATEAYAQGTVELAIMCHGRWKSAAVMRGYVEEGTIWTAMPSPAWGSRGRGSLAAVDARVGTRGCR
jgi:hypothetical protein